MAIFGEPAAKRRRLLNHSEEPPAETTAPPDDESLLSDLIAVSPWEIITHGPPLYDAILSNDRLLASDTVQRLFRILSQHLECCMNWRANDTDELDDQDLYSSAVKELIMCLQYTYNPDVTDVSFLVLARALVFLQRLEDSEVASNALLEIIHYQTTNPNHNKEGFLSGLSISQQLEFLVALLQDKSTTSTNVLKLLAKRDTFARIALRVDTNEPPTEAIYPQTLLETLFEWRCHLVATTDIEPIIDTLSTVLTSKTTSWVERGQAVEVLASMSKHSYTSKLVSIVSAVVLQAHPGLSSVAVIALQNLLDDGERIKDCIKNLKGQVLPFLSALLRISREVPSPEYLLPSHDVGVWAIELFWTFISFLVCGVDGVAFDSQRTADLALSSVDDCAGDEYKVYLAAKTICRDNWDYFLDESHRESLVQALSLILGDKESSEVSIGYALTSLQDLVGSDREASSLVARDRGLLDRIAGLGAIASNDEASLLLFELSDHAPNRRLLIRRPRVLIAMMRYAQQQRNGEKAGYFQMRVGQLADLF